MLFVPQRIPTSLIVEAAVSLEPVDNALLTMIALLYPENYEGIDPWVAKAVQKMGPDRHQEHRFVISSVGLDGLANLAPQAADFDDYLQQLEATEPISLRDTLFYWLFHSPHVHVKDDSQYDPPADLSPMIEDLDLFINGMSELLTSKMVPTRLQEVHQFYQDPSTLKIRLINHLTYMWTQLLQPEWACVRPRLEDSVNAFNAIPLNNLTIFEAMERVTGRDLRFGFDIDAIQAYRKIRFIPHAHNGPYVVWYGDHEELRISFPPRIPETVSNDNTQHYDRTALANRYKALGDEIRLQILSIITQAGEVSTQDIIDRLKLDKSAASRHLRQLVATSLLVQRRESGAKKVYRLNPAAIQEMEEMLATLK